MPERGASSLSHCL